MALKEILSNIRNTINRWITESKEIQRQKEIQIQENIRIAGEHFINGYGENFHCSNKQYDRFQRALSPDSIGRIVSVDRKKLSMRICSSRNSDNIYNVTLTHCDCEDFKKRNSPCKHMYKFALQLGIIDEHWDLSGLSPALKEELDSLPQTALRTLTRLMYYNRNTDKFQANKKAASPLVKRGFLIEYNVYELLLDQNYTKEEILAFASSSSSCPVRAKDKKADIIRYIIGNEPKLLKALCDKCYTVSFSDTLTNNFDCIYRYCENLQNDCSPNE